LKRKSPLRLILRTALGASACLLLLSALWLGLRSLAARAFPGFAFAPRPLALELAVYVLSIVAFGFSMSLVGRFMSKGRRRDYFAELRSALRKIASGDFDVALSLRAEGREGPFGDPFGEVAGELNDMARALKRMEELRQEFISTVSHDIQSPLTSIGGFARALREEGLSRELREHYLDIIERESGRLSRLSDDLLRLTVLEARSPRLSEEPYRLDEQIRAVVLASEPQWKEKGLVLELDLEELRIRGDADMLFQAWANLFHNAVKFSPRGGRIALSLRGGGHARFRIEDEGPGIDPADLGFVFDRFFKADRSRSRADPGTGSGLGLAIVRKVVELHGGAVRAESGGLGMGSAFSVDLPLGGGPSA
jgi:two-component system, OmpR family, phosphate regulon sensor histidine kinase PhoR